MVEYGIFHALLLWLVLMGIAWVSSFLFVVLASYVVCKIVKTEFYSGE